MAGGFGLGETVGVRLGLGAMGGVVGGVFSFGVEGGVFKLGVLGGEAFSLGVPGGVAGGALGIGVVGGEALGLEVVGGVVGGALSLGVVGETLGLGVVGRVVGGDVGPRELGGVVGGVFGSGVLASGVVCLGVLGGVVGGALILSSQLLLPPPIFDRLLAEGPKALVEAFRELCRVLWTSLEELSSFNVYFRSVIFFLELVGEDGTLLAPSLLRSAFTDRERRMPDLEGECDGEDRFSTLLRAV